MGGVKGASKRVSDIKENSIKNAQTASQRTPNQSENGKKTNRQHVGKSLGTGGADTVVCKVDASNRRVDLQRHAGNAIVSMVTGG